MVSYLLVFNIMIFSLYLRIPTSCETSWRIRDTRQGAISRSGVAAWGSNFFSKSLGAETQCHHQVNGHRNETHSSLFLLHERNPGSSGWRWLIDAPSDKRFINFTTYQIFETACSWAPGSTCLRVIVPSRRPWLLVSQSSGRTWWIHVVSTREERDVNLLRWYN